MTNPLSFQDLNGNEQVEPSRTARVRVIEAARFTGENPFVPTLLAAFRNGDPDELQTFYSLGDALDAHDPERIDGTPSTLLKYAFRPSPDAAVQGARTLRTVRVGAGDKTPIQAAASAQDATPENVLTLTALEYGVDGNRLRYKFEADSDAIEGTAQAGAAATITLAAGNSSAVDSAYRDWYVYTTGGTGDGQLRKITAYVGATKVATVAAWDVQPDNTTTYVVFRGLKAFVGYRDNPAWIKTGDRLGPLFTLKYTLACTTATVTVTAAVAGTATRLQTEVVDPAAGTGNLNLDLTTDEFATVQDVVNFINRQPGYEATPFATDLDLSACPSSQIDAIAAGNIKAINRHIEAKLGAIVQWFAANVTRIGPVRGVEATRVATKTAAPVPMVAWAQLAGGDAPAVDVDDYDAALDVLEREEIEAGMLFVDTSDDGVRDTVIAWMDEQAALGRMWRASFGLPAGTADLDAQIAAGSIARKTVAIFHQRFVDPLDATVTHAPVVAAAAFAGMTGGMNVANDVQTAVLTGRRIRAASLLKADRRTKPQRNALLKAGVNVFREEKPGGRVFLSMAVSTDQSQTRAYRMWSESVVLDLITWSLLQAAAPLNVAWGTPQYVAAVRSNAQTQLNGWGNKNNPVISAGTDPETGAEAPAFTPPRVVVSNGRTTITSTVGFIGESDHMVFDLTVVKLNLESEAA